MYKYSLDRSSKKFHCPQCSKRTFVRYVFYEDNQLHYAPDTFGRCDREVNCGYFKSPKEEKTCIADFAPKVHQKKIPNFLPADIVTPTLEGYQQSNLFKFLATKIPVEKLYQQAQLYKIGVDKSSPYTKDWVIFWQHDIHGNCRSGKAIKYLPTGKRCKGNAATWMHAKENHLGPIYPNFVLEQCLFGEHLIFNHPTKPIAVVESEKTAFIASLFIDRFIWLACGGLTQLGGEKAAVLKNRSVTLFPDLGGFEKWSTIADEYHFNISNHLEKIATEEDRKAGKDLADYLI